MTSLLLQKINENVNFQILKYTLTERAYGCSFLFNELSFILNCLNLITSIIYAIIFY